MNLSLTEKNQIIIDTLKLLEDSYSQCDYLMMKGMNRNSVPEIRMDKFRIGGCKTAIWVRTGLTGRSVRFEADSDSLLVRGVLVFFDDLYAGSPIEEACKCPPRFLDYISEEVIYREIKANGLHKCFLRIKALMQ